MPANASSSTLRFFRYYAASYHPTLSSKNLSHLFWSLCWSCSHRFARTFRNRILLRVCILTEYELRTTPPPLLGVSSATASSLPPGFFLGKAAAFFHSLSLVYMLFPYVLSHTQPDQKCHSCDLRSCQSSSITLQFFTTISGAPLCLACFELLLLTLSSCFLPFSDFYLQHVFHFQPHVIVIQTMFFK